MARQGSAVGLQEVQAMASRAGFGRITCDDGGARSRTRIVEGRVLVSRLPSGIGVHATDGVETTDLNTRVTLRPAITVSLLLDGSIDAALDGAPVRFAAGAEPAGRLWAFTRPTTLVRGSTPGRRVRKVNVTAPQSWVESVLAPTGRVRSGSDIAALFAEPLALRAWRPSAEAVRCAERLLALDGTEEPLALLGLEIGALGILYDALSHVLSAAAPEIQPEKRPRDVARARAARDYILTHIEQPLCLARIARETGMSVSTLQRVFRACYGVTVVEFLRRRRLELARQALARDGMTVAEAAYGAGYASPANFATAFQRAFGHPPSQARGAGVRRP